MDVEILQVEKQKKHFVSLYTLLKTFVKFLCLFLATHKKQQLLCFAFLLSVGPVTWTLRSQPLTSRKSSFHQRHGFNYFNFYSIKLSTEIAIKQQDIACNSICTSWHLSICYNVLFIQSVATNVYTVPFVIYFKPEWSLVSGASSITPNLLVSFSSHIIVSQTLSPFMIHCKTFCWHLFVFNQTRNADKLCLIMSKQKGRYMLYLTPFAKVFKEIWVFHSSGKSCNFIDFFKSQKTISALLLMRVFCS